MDSYKVLVVVLVVTAVWIALHVILAAVLMLAGQLVSSDRKLVFYFGTCALVVCAIIICAALAIMHLGGFWLC